MERRKRTQAGKMEGMKEETKEGMKEGRKTTQAGKIKGKRKEGKEGRQERWKE